MNRIITIGCSHTYGDALDDNWDFEKNETVKNFPSKLSWATILGKKMGMESVNLSLSGASNYSIQQKLVTTTLKKTDIVFILWTYPDRIHFFRDEIGKHIFINSWSDTNIAKLWYENFHFDYDNYLKNTLIINQTDSFLKNKVQKCYHMIVEESMIRLFDNNIHKIPILSSKFENILNSNPKANDNWHMGKQGHELFSEEIIKSIGDIKII